MRVSIVPSEAPAETEGGPRIADRLLRKAVFAQLSGLTRGRLAIHDADGEHDFGPGRGAREVSARVYVHDARTYSRIALRGTVGAGEAYMLGWWDCDDLTAVVRIMVLNRPVMESLEGGLARLAMPMLRLYHALRRNTRRRSAENIAAHYDLGNAFYRLWLDESMTYSCGLFDAPDTTLSSAQRAKYERICQQLSLGSGDRVLEVGGGWGGFALHAAANHGCHVTTTTISDEQYEYIRKRVREAGLSDRVTVLCRDYRDLQGRFDKLVSIEMFEAVGHQYFETYFDTCSRLLEPHGLMLLQSITISEAEFERAKREVDFIQRYVFPGGCLPSVSAMMRAVSRASDLRVVKLQDIGLHYATTLRHWRQRFNTQLPAVRQLGFGDRFTRLWNFYLSYCEGGFEERAIGTLQVLFEKADHRPRRG
jgi:cyclopropane-fatty-acyl-phospholipid synthase